MDLSPAEEVVIGLLRGEHGIDFTFNVSTLGPVWSVSITTEGDGILAGRGDTFRQAIRAAFGVEGDPGSGEAQPRPMRPVLRLVEQVRHPAEDDHPRMTRAVA